MSRRITLPNRGRRRGMTLVEVVITIAIVMVGSVATFSLLTFSHTQNAFEQERARAHQIVLEFLERTKSDLFSQVTAIPAQQTVWDNATPNDPKDDTVGTISVIIRDMDGNVLSAAPVPAEMIQVDVTLTWNPRGRLRDAKTYSETVVAYMTP